MLFNLRNAYEHERFKAYVNKLYQERAVVEVKRKHPGRTLRQNSYLHLLLGYFGCEYGCSLDEAKVDFYKRFLQADVQPRPLRAADGQQAGQGDHLPPELRRPIDRRDGPLHRPVPRLVGKRGGHLPTRRRGDRDAHLCPAGSGTEQGVYMK